ncbi:MAG: cytidylate kinase, partial [Candidatus Cloacimonadaceae bacterium]|nr:cytidylate kinase [Candidatus Cloacimonadaceae bacterium]
MIIRLAKHSGYCFGVKRAITSALDAANLHQKVFTIGPLIHNPQIVEHLQKLGIEVATEIDKVKDSTVIVRSHGICKEEMQTLQSGKNIIIDATCPYVSRTHEIVSQLVKEGYPVYI